MDGVLTSSTTEGTWAYFGIEVPAVSDLTESAEYADLKEAERFERAMAADIQYLGSCLAPANHLAIELRWRNDPPTGALRLAILGRCFAQNEAAAAQMASGFCRMLLATPSHVFSVPITDDQVLHGWLNGSEAGPGGAVEIRKRVLMGQPQRPDAGVDYYMSVQPFTAVAIPWNQLLRTLATHPEPISLSIGLESMAVEPWITDTLEACATRYGALSRETEMEVGVLSSSMVRLMPDAFAVAAAPTYADAAARYRGKCFRIRIALSSPSPLSPSLAELVGSTVNPPDVHVGAAIRGAQEARLLGATYAVVSASEQDRPLFNQNLATLGHAAWAPAAPFFQPKPPGAALFELTRIVDAREAAAAFRLPAAATGAVPGMEVRIPSVHVRAAWTATGDHLVLGTQKVNGVDEGPLGIHLANLPMHAMFVGSPGSGKTSSVISFLLQLWRDHRVPFLVIEPVNSTDDDYRWFLDEPGFEDLLVLTVGDEASAPLRLNPFEVPRGVPVETHMGGLLSAFDAGFGLWGRLPDIYRKALEDMYNRAEFVHDGTRRAIGTYAVSGPEHDGWWPTLSEFTRSLERITDALKYSQQTKDELTEASLGRAESLATGATSLTLDVGRSFPVEELLRRPVVIELARLSNEKERAFFSALLLNAMTESYKFGAAHSLLPKHDGLSHVTVIEEAHGLLGAPSASGDTEADARAQAATQFANMLAENRKYGEAIVIVEQIPTLLVEGAYKNTGLKVMHRLPAKDDREVIGATMHMNEDAIRRASGLEPMHAYVYSNEIDRPAHVEVPHVRKLAAQRSGEDRRQVSDQRVHERFVEVLESSPALRAAMAPFAECGSCRNVCAHRAAARSRVRVSDRADEAKAIIEKLPSKSASRAEVQAYWAEVVDLVDRVGALARPDDPASAAEYDACVFVHLHRQTRALHDRLKQPAQLSELFRSERRALTEGEVP